MNRIKIAIAALRGHSILYNMNISQGKMSPKSNHMLVFNNTFEGVWGEKFARNSVAFEDQSREQPHAKG